MVGIHVYLVYMVQNTTMLLFNLIVVEVCNLKLYIAYFTGIELFFVTAFISTYMAI